MVEKRLITMAEVQFAAEALAVRAGIAGRHDVPIWGVPRGGVPAALAVSKWGGHLVDDPRHATLIIDDLIDSGATMRRYQAAEGRSGWPFEALFDKRSPPWSGQWLVMPWEVNEGVDRSGDDIVIRLLEYIGEDPNREGLQETPRRVLAAWKEWAQGYGKDPKELLKTFEDGAQGVDEMVIVHNIPVVSKCEHHLADFIGVAHVGYIPNGKIVGISKLARLVDLYARRLQVQERLTNQIANAIEEVIAPKGIGVLIRASHHCMITRGVKTHNSVTTTSAMRGALLSKPEARAEFLELCRAAEK